ncbi:MAG: signal peptide peptidase SppA [Myxococcota bacterium]|nr:signal peptide peptidase SppA [Myxococcota bacterium]
MRAIYLASAADRIYLHPSGGFMLHGLSITRTYLKGMLDKLGVNAQFVKWEAYKAAPERLTRAGPSEPAREQTQEMLAGFDRAWYAAVGQGRKLSKEALDGILSDGPQTMKMAHELGLVDRIVHDDELKRALSEDLGREVRLVKGYRPARSAWRRWRSPRRIAIVPVVGTIVDGKSDLFKLPVQGQSTGEVDFVKAMKRAARDPEVVGIVVRVSSPGGSVVASERMHRAVVKAMGVKPVVVSFGDIAASGGYYLACAADRIVASPLTITGSIGIFTGKVDLSGLYEKIGVTSSTERTRPSADAHGTHRPWTPEEEKVARERLKAYYDIFVEHVAKGRSMEVAKAEQRARGRVYIGERAIALDLVDREGSLWDAIGVVRAQAGIDPGEALDLGYGPERGFLDKLTLVLSGALGAVAHAPMEIPNALRPLTRLLTAMVSLERSALQARLPYDIEVK